VFPENIVFEGAGVRGIAYSGVIRTLEQRNIIQHIKRVGGTSAGAITALMVSLGYNSVEIYKIISDTKFQKFNDGEFFFVGGLSRIKTRYGWYKGNEFTKWLEKIIKDKTGNSEMTFSDLSEKKFKELYVTATCLNKQKLLVFSAETYPKMKIKDAVRISMSIPIYFEAVFIDSLGRVHKKQHSGKNLDVVVDGGIIGNFPIFIFDSIRTNSSLNTRIPNYKTIGVRIDTDSQIQNDSLSKELVPIDIKNFSDYLTAFYVLTLEKLNRATLVSQDWERTISVSSVGIGPKIKKLSADQKAALIKSGEDFTSMFLDKMPSKIFKP
jgi:NTE family protein